MKTSRLGVVFAIATAATLADAGSVDNRTSGHVRVVPDTVGCLDTLHATDSIGAIVKMSVRSRESKIVLPPNFEGILAQEFRSRLKVPRHLALSVMTGWDACDTVKCASGVLMVGVQAYATAHRDGSASRIEVVDYALTPKLADTVKSVLTRIGRERLMPVFDQPDSIPLEISISLEQNPDSVPAYRHMFRVAIPRFKLPYTAAAYPRGVFPQYPLTAERRGIADTISLAFTILPDGRILPPSVDVLKGHYREFVKAVFDMLETARYIPARIGTCPVATHERQTFEFRVRR